MATNRETEQAEQKQNEARRITTGEQPAGRVPNKPNDQPSPADSKTAEGEAKRAPYSVAPGKSVVGGRGVIDAGQEIRAEDVGGQERLDRLVERGDVVKA